MPIRQPLSNRDSSQLVAEFVRIPRTTCQSGQRRLASLWQDSRHYGSGASMNVVILAPRDEAVPFLGQVLSQATTCTAAPAFESLQTLNGIREVSAVRPRPARVNRQHSSRGARMTTLRCCDPSGVEPLSQRPTVGCRTKQDSTGVNGENRDRTGRLRPREATRHLHLPRLSVSIGE